MKKNRLTLPGQARICRSVRAKYAAVARSPAGRFPYPVGRASASRLGYEPSWLARIPSPVVRRFVGAGNPFSIHRPAPGAHVLDLGCGSGFDVFVASLLVGPSGKAAGVDLTEAMLAPARAAARRWKHGRVAFRRASAERLPFPDASFDVVISNGALNLVPDKDRAYREAFRVLRPGGVLAVADLLVVESVPRAVLADMDAWST